MSAEDIRLAVRLTPRAARDAIGGKWIDAAGAAWLAVSVTSPPDKGRANAALIDLLGKRLGVPRSSISLAAGATSRLKRLIIDGADAPVADRIAAKIRQWME